MKKALYIYLLLLFGQGVVNAQSSQTNLTKYWWYRYQLVNDFMKIGDQCGESLPAGRRNMSNWDIPDDLPNRPTIFMDWGDATVHLGQYMLVLATEYRLLHNSGQNTNRTLYEIYYALKAFDRIDLTAEARCRDFRKTQFCDNIYPENNDLNGFFIRDDVPEGFEARNHQHFNRPGSCIYVSGENSSIVSRMDGHVMANGRRNGVTWEFAYFTLPTSAPLYPTEMSQDQLTEIYSGLAMLTYQLNEWETYNGENLKDLAKHALLRATFYCHKNGWQIVNPLTGIPVYGIEPGHYGDFLAAGSAIQVCAPAMAKGLSNINANWDGNEQSIVHMMDLSSTIFNTIHQGWKYYNLCGAKGEYGGHKAGGDQPLFAATFAAYGRSWTNGVGKNITKDALMSLSVNCKFRWPHLPLIYRLINGGTLSDPTKVFPYYQPATYEGLLNEAPNCNFYNYDPYKDGDEYKSTTPGWEWSSPNRLAESFKRGEANSKAYFPGISYMALFNLYALNKPDYTKWKYGVNPYYQEDFDFSFPYHDPNNGSLVGYTGHNYEYKTLEYLSARNHISSDGDVTYRNAKTIELLPGFEAEYGSTFLAFIRDYHCCSAAAYSEKTTTSDVIPDDAFTMDEHFQANLAPTFIPDQETPDYEMTPEERAEDSAAVVAQIYNSGNPEIIDLYNRLMHSEESSSMMKKMPSSSLPSGDNVTMFPNPTSGSVTIQGSIDGGSVDIYNATGTKVATYPINGNMFNVNIGNYARGIYLFKVYSDKKILLKSDLIILN